ncbi:MAG: hypothetical protein AB1489_13565 [Acidobacteriota bacterium]
MLYQSSNTIINDHLENNPMRLYVGNIPYRATTEELQKLFTQFGTVTSINIVTDKDTGQSKGFAFVDIDGDFNTIISYQPA